MFGVDRGYVESMKKKFPAGTRIECIYCADMYHPIESGEKGTVRCVDDMGTVHVKWDSGRELGLCAEEDSFRAID